MQISMNQRIAGYPAPQVRDFVRGHRVAGIVSESAQIVLALNPEAASDFLNQLMDLGFIRKCSRSNDYLSFELTHRGYALANASAAKPINRKTAERILAQFNDRMHEVNATSKYLFQVSEAILFGSMLSDVECLGDVDVAIELEAKVSDGAAFQEWSMARRHEAEAEGRSFRTAMDYFYWPIQEVCLQLKARTRGLSLHMLEGVRCLPNLSYQILLGDPERVAALIPTGRAVRI